MQTKLELRNRGGTDRQGAPKAMLGVLDESGRVHHNAFILKGLAMSHT